MRVVKQQILELEAADEFILRQIAGATRQTRAGVLRWALRWYLLGGPWAESPERRVEIVKECTVGPIGPPPMRGGAL